MAETTQTPSMSTFRGAGEPIASAVESEQRRRGMRADSGDIGSELMAAVSDSATALFEEQRNRAADEIAAMGEVLRHSVQSIDQVGVSGDGLVARCGDEAARQISDFAMRLRRRSWGELTGDIEDFARRYPMAFIGAATGLGFLAGRILTASATQLLEQTPPQSSSGWQPGQSGTGGEGG